MGLLNSALQIGRSAILGYQSGLQVVGNNISSAGSPDYTRLTPQLDPLQGQLVSAGLQPGAGVALTAIQRNIDEALEGRLRESIGANASSQTQLDVLAQVEILFDDLTGAGIGARLSEFFQNFDELQNTPEDVAIRDLVIAGGANLASSIRGLRGQLTALTEDVNTQIEGLVGTADQIAENIARLNSEITAAEAGRGGQANALRDQRDGLLRRLSEIFDVSVREQSDGTINVYVGNEAIVQGGRVRGLVAVEEFEGDLARVTVRFADTNQQIQPAGGRLAGLLLSRDQDDQIDLLDQLTAALIEDVNRIHADGQGTVGITSLVGAADVLDADAPLDSAEAGLAFPPTNGSFFLTVLDTQTRTPVTSRIDVDLDGTAAGTTLNELVAMINEQVEGATATVTSDNRLAINADDGFSFTFGTDGQDARADTSGVLVGLGVNTFFTGTDSSNIGINSKLIENPSLLASASEFRPGDGSIAGRIAALNSSNSERLETTSIPSFYRSISARIAVRGASARDDVITTETVFQSLSAQREAVSGVSLDEEAIALVKFERAFQGAARFIRTVDDLLAELVSLIR